MEFKPRRFNGKDIPVRVNWINDPRINQTMFFDLPASIINTENWYNNNRGNSKRIDFSFVNNEDEIIAMGGFTDINSLHKNAEFYVMVNPEMQGRGIGKQVSFWMYNYAFSILDLNKIFLYTNDDNIAAFSIYEKAGFQLEGVLRNHKWKNNKFQNRRFYGLLKSEWKNLEWKEILHDEL
ncbi:GNAT family N-acetyltransferase [Empedobacter brevis]|uniref:GNAT family N-acetyltransferase n=1 Tax=Empedobacter brevis TaxID=247 RepID=UPI00289905DB|nr:GNAT family protein [Empedobacter brevis]